MLWAGATPPPVLFVLSRPMPPLVAFGMVLPSTTSSVVLQRTITPQPVSGAASPSGDTPMMLPRTMFRSAFGDWTWMPS